MLRADLASFRVVGGEIVPDWLGPTDHPWLRDVLDRVVACAGRRVHDLDRALRRPMVRVVPTRRLRMAIAVIRNLVDTHMPRMAIDPSEVRDALFHASSSARCTIPWSRDDVLLQVARALRKDVPTLEGCLFLDLPPERLVVLPTPLPAPADLVLLTNLALVQTLVLRAASLRIRAFGGSRDLVRHVRLRGLLCVARRVPSGVELEVSGPVALFRRTTLYGRASASLVPRLPWCERFDFEARCVVRDTEAVLRLQPSDPIFPAAPPRRFDSRIEEVFARDLARRFPDWTLVRETEPVDVDGTLVFPDFTLFRDAEPEIRWTIEIVGFWTPEYLRTKLDRLARAGSWRWIACIDERLNCGDTDLPPTLHVVRYRRRIDPGVVIEIASQSPVNAPAVPPSGPEVERARLGPRSYFLDWAGRRSPSDGVHAKLASLRPGAPMRLKAERGFCFVADHEDHPVAALAASAREEWIPRLARIRDVRIREMLPRSRDQSGITYRSQLLVDRWTVPLVDITWDP